MLAVLQTRTLSALERGAQPCHIVYLCLLYETAQNVLSLGDLNQVPEVDEVEDSRTSGFHYNLAALNEPSSMDCPSTARLSDSASLVSLLSASALDFE